MKLSAPKPLRRSTASHQCLPLVALALALAGCSSQEGQASKGNTPSSATSNDVSATVTGAETPTETPAPSLEPNADQTTQLKISDLITALNKNNLEVTGKHPMFFEMVQASDGYSLTIDHKEIEVYQADLSTEKGRNALEVWREYGVMRFPTKVHRNLAICSFDDHPKAKEILAVFEGL